VLDVTCEHCGKILKIPEEYLGQRGRCNRCHGVITVTVAPLKFSAEAIQAAAESEQEQGENGSLQDLPQSSEAIIPYKCPMCGTLLHIPARYAGQRKRCTTCNAMLTVPRILTDEEPPQPPRSTGTVPPTVPVPPTSAMLDHIHNIGKGLFAGGCLILLAPVIIALFVIGFALLSYRTSTPPAPTRQASARRPTQEPRPPSVRPQKAPSTVTDAEVKEIALREYPNDYAMQNYVYDQQLAAKQYVGTVTDGEVKQIALREYPNDYSMQKYVYDQQLSAKRYMAEVTDREVKQIALREYPNDYAMQNYVYDQQLAAKQYAGTVTDGEVKQIALREHPNDYSMQEYVYDQQLSAKRYMAEVTDREVKQIALREHPNDYSMQKYVYDQQLSAKQYMSAVGNSAAKSRAQREYPNDYTMQKYVYDQALKGP